MTESKMVEGKPTLTPTRSEKMTTTVKGIHEETKRKSAAATSCSK